MGRLCLSRRPGESVVLRDQNGERLGEVTVERVNSKTVRLSFSLLPEIQITREEIDTESKPCHSD